MGNKLAIKTKSRRSQSGIHGITMRETECGNSDKDPRETSSQPAGAWVQEWRPHGWRGGLVNSPSVSLTESCQRLSQQPLAHVSSPTAGLAPNQTCQMKDKSRIDGKNSCLGIRDRTTGSITIATERSGYSYTRFKITFFIYFYFYYILLVAMGMWRCL